MKNRFSTLISMIATVAVTAVAQTADIEVSYNHHYLSSTGKERDINYHLLANPQQSKYFNLQSEQIDSLCSTPQGEAQFKEAQSTAMKSMLSQGMIDMSKLPRKPTKLYVVKSATDSTTTVYDALGKEHVSYTEPFSEMTWTIGDGTKNILGYDCIEATTDYHGRKWTAWFTPDIPLSDGPWKFRGLPGLILEVGDATGRYSFTADGITKSDREIPAMYRAEIYDKSDRKSILRAKRASVDNPMGSLNADNIRVHINPSDLPKVDPDYDLIETDYR